jgi:hypothetical protein
LFPRPRRCSFSTVPRPESSSNIVASSPWLVFTLIHIERENVSKGGIYGMSMVTSGLPGNRKSKFPERQMYGILQYREKITKLFFVNILPYMNYIH